MMTKKFTKFLFVNTNYYLKTKKGFEKVKAIPINILDMDFFIFKNNIKYFCIVDGISGCRLTKFHKTPIQAKKELLEQIGFQNSRQVEMKIFSFLKKHKLSPRYRYISNPTRDVATR